MEEIRVKRVRIKRRRGKEQRRDGVLQLIRL